MRGMHPRAANFMLALVFWTSGILLVADRNVLADSPTTITSSGLNTQVGAPTLLPSGEITHDITGGTRPGNGANLFHSFGDFSVGTNNIANFLNDSGLPTANILGRVTGGDVSNIFGTIQTTGFGNANLFLMNPAGFLFGPTATVNVGGMMTFTTADYMRLADGARFKAMPNAAADMLLSAAPVAAFGFLGSNPGAITVQGSQFSVADGTGISLVGGKITIQSGTLGDGTVQPASLSAPGGHINLVSVAKPKNPTKGGEISATDFSPSATAGFKSLGTVEISEGAIISTNTSGEMSGGTVFIRAGKLTVVDSSLTADGSTEIANGFTSPGGRVEVHAGTVMLDQATISANSAKGSGGQIIFTDLATLTGINSTLEANVQHAIADDGAVRGGSLTIGSSETESVTLIDTTLSASSEASAGNGPVGPNPTDIAGDITVSGKTINIHGGSVASNAGAHSARAGGLVTFNGDRIALTDTRVSATNNGGGGSGGIISLQGLRSEEAMPTRASSLVIDNSSIAVGVVGTHFGGDLTVHAKDVTLSDARLQANGSRQGGSLNLADVGTLRSTNSSFSSIGMFLGDGGSMILGSSATKSVILENSTLSASSERGDGGAINITAGKDFQSVGTTLDVSSALGNGGAISIRAGRLSVTDGSTVNAVGASPAQDGTILFQYGKTLTVQDSVVTPEATVVRGWNGK